MKKIIYLLVIFVFSHICSCVVYASSLNEVQKVEAFDSAEEIKEGEIIQYLFTEKDFKTESFYTSDFPKKVDGLYVKIYKFNINKNNRLIVLNGNTDIDGKTTITLNDEDGHRGVISGFNNLEFFENLSYDKGTCYIIIKSETLGSFHLIVNSELFIDYDFVFMCVFSVVIIIISIISALIYHKIKNNNDIKLSSEEYNQKIMGIIQNQNSEDKSSTQVSQDRNSDILTQMVLTLSEMKEYRLKSDKHMNLSFQLSIVLMVCGLLFISISFGLTIINNKFDIVAILPAITGSLMELMGGGCLIIYKKSLEQIEIYYQYLHENESFILSVYLSDKLDDEKRYKSYEKIIELQMKKNSKDVEKEE